MNIWARRSIERAHKPGYLDELASIYQVEKTEERDVPAALMSRIREAYAEHDDAVLVASLLELDKFPFDDPYVRLLKKLPDAVKLNPATVGRIAERVRLMGLSQLEIAIRAPKVANRQLGSRFSVWLSSLEYKPLLSESELLRSDGKIALLAGSDETKKNFAAKHLGYAGTKGLDLVAKCGSRFVIGEAKLFTDHGGHQDRQFDDAMGLLEGQGSLVDTTAVAVLDGVVWIRGRGRMYRTVSSTEHDVVSALLLTDYLESLM